MRVEANGVHLYFFDTQMKAKLTCQNERHYVSVTFVNNSAKEEGQERMPMQLEEHMSCRPIR